MATMSYDANPNNNITADEPTIVRMVVAFGDCQSECGQIESTVVGAQAGLAAQWQSDQAAPAFQRAVDQWISGFKKVRAGLDMLNGNMQEYAKLTTSTEDDVALQAGGWANG